MATLNYFPRRTTFIGGLHTAIIVLVLFGWGTAPCFSQTKPSSQPSRSTIHRINFDKLFQALPLEKQREAIKKAAAGGLCIYLPHVWRLIDDPVTALAYLKTEKEPYKPEILNALARAIKLPAKEWQTLRLAICLYRYHRKPGLAELRKIMMEKEALDNPAKYGQPGSAFWPQRAALVLAMNREHSALKGLLEWAKSPTVDPRVLQALAAWQKGRVAKIT